MGAAGRLSFEFVDVPMQATVVVDESVRTVDALFDVFWRGLAFPDYFGWNWDAFSECILDLSWLEGDQARGDVVTIYHSGVPCLAPPDLQIYLCCLAAIPMGRSPHEKPHVRVLFRSRDRAQVEALLAGARGCPPV